MIIKKWNTSTTAWEPLSPKVTYTDIVADVTAGTPTSIFSGGKLLANYLPDFVFGGLNFEGALTSTNADTDTEMAALLDAVYQARGSVNLEGMVGSYWIANASIDQNISMQSFQAGSTGRYYETTSNYNMEEGQGPTADEITLEAGDWLVIQGVSGSGTQADPFLIDFSVVNNTYKIAGNNTAGIIKIGYTENGKNYPVELASGKAYVNVPWDDTNTFRTVTAGGNTLGASETLAFTAGTNVQISESAGAVTISSTDTNYTAGQGIGLTNEEFSVAAGGGLTQDANGLSHADTSSQASSSNSGRTYIQSIVLDTYGHITSLSTATETVTDTTYSAGNGIALSGGNQFSVSGGQGLTTESSGLRMTYPVYHGDTLPTLTSDSSYSNVIGFEW